MVLSRNLPKNERRDRVGVPYFVRITEYWAELVKVVFIATLVFCISQLLSSVSPFLIGVVAYTISIFSIYLFGSLIPVELQDSTLLIPFLFKFTKFFITPVYPLFSRMMRRYSKEIEEEQNESDDSVIEEMQSSNDRQIFKRIFNFSDKSVSEVLMPKERVVKIDYSMTAGALLEVAQNSGYSRMPVVQYIDEKEVIKGFLYVKDMVGMLKPNEYSSAGQKRFIDEYSWHSLIRQPYFVWEGMRIIDLLDEFRQKRVHFAVVNDSRAMFRGIVTLEDILEEIVGEISDETD